MASYHCVVNIRTRNLFDGDIYYANIPGVDGQYGVLPNHELLVSLNIRGGMLTLNLDEAGNEQRKFLVYGGATQMMDDVLTILGQFIVEADNIDKQAVQEDADEAKSRIEKLESQDEAELSKQDQARLRVYKHRLRWDEFQLNYLETGAHTA